MIVYSLQPREALIENLTTGRLAIIPGGLRAVYRTLELPSKHTLKDAHANLEAAVLAAFGFSAKADLLKQLFDLNHNLAAKEKSEKAVTPPGIPSSYGDSISLVSTDRIEPRDFSTAFIKL